jgi:hypothetical protein
VPSKGVGDYATPRLIVDPFGNDTTATVTVYGPDGTAAGTPSAAPSGIDGTTGGQIWTAAPYLLTAPRVWREHWVVTGTGAGTQDRRLYVSPVVVDPAWSPPAWKPADYVPGRTLVPVLASGGNTWVNTFDDTTNPSGEQVERLTTDACAWVSVGCGTIAATLFDAASAAAAVWVAAQIEAGYPDKSSDPGRAAALLDQAQRMRADLAKANEALTGTDPVDPGAALLPLYSFPRPDYRDRWI